MRLPDLRNHRFLVFGAARSGIAAARLLHRHDLPVAVADEKPRAEKAAEAAELDAAGILSSWCVGTTGLPAGFDILVKSPGIDPTNPLVLGGVAKGLRMISEIELASAFVDPESRVVAVTGTNGKTTTTAWTAHILREAGFNAVGCGNIGNAWANVADAPENRGSATVFVVEASSFQLEDVEEFRPDVAVLTNLAPDHLDRYRDYGAYVDAKRNLLRKMRFEDAFVWNRDNPDSAEFATGLSPRCYCFSAGGDPGLPGAFVADDRLCIRGADGELIPLMPAGELPLVGRHNVENSLAAALAAYLAGADPGGIVRGLRSFPGVEHRIEFCGERDGVKFYNDSKATNIDSLEKALVSFREPIVLIAGGRDKKSDYGSLSALVGSRVKRLVTLGEAAPLIEAAWGALVPTERADGMADAVAKAAAAALAGDVVLLSPACTSWDMYPSYEYRGRDFKSRVAELPGIS
jgi:UDP-N-acetylmuramoylalanine--D-glutamate ligase